MTDDRPQFDSSFKPFYQLAFAVGVGIMIYIYFVIFDDLSEEQLVNYSGAWFLLFVFGGSGLALEASARLVNEGKVESLSRGMIVHGCGTMPVAWLFFFPLFFYNAAKEAKSTLPVALYITIVWGVLLYGFLIGVFPNL